jgi:hypothetical protein
LQKWAIFNDITPQSPCDFCRAGIKTRHFTGVAWVVRGEIPSHPPVGGNPEDGRIKVQTGKG